MSEIHVTGLADLQKFLDKLPAKMEANVMRGALRQAAKVVAAEAKRLCPESPAPKRNRERYGSYRGALRDSIKISVRVVRGKVTGFVKAGNDKAWYARFVEFGTAKHWIQAKTRPQRITRRGVVKMMSINTMNRKARRGELVIGGKFVGEQIIHPGARQKPFMRPALDGRAQDAIVAAAEYIKRRLATKHGLDTADVEIGGLS